jgi:hypothetical protein
MKQLLATLATYDTANGYTAAQIASGTAPCITTDTGQYGAGQDIMAWFNANSSGAS